MVIVPHIDLIGTMGPDMTQMFFEDLLRDPVIGKGRALQGTSVICRCPVGGMGIPEMYMHHPVILFPVLLQPFQHMGRHHLGGLAAPASHIVALMKACIEPPGTVPLCEGGKGYRAHPCPPKLHEKAIF